MMQLLLVPRMLSFSLHADLCPRQVYLNIPLFYAQRSCFQLLMSLISPFMAYLCRL